MVNVSMYPFTCSALQRRLLVNCVFCCKEGKKKLKEMKEAFTECEMMTS